MMDEKRFLNEGSRANERPILFYAPMVRAILAGTKTQTRRAVRTMRGDGGYVMLEHETGMWPYRSDDGDSSFHTVKRGGSEYLDQTPHKCPYGQPGDRLWVRETWKPVCAGTLQEVGKIGTSGDMRYGFAYAADNAVTWNDRVTHVSVIGGGVSGPAHISDKPAPWRPSIHMPRRASRITLEITGVRVERLQDISEADAIAEGVTFSTPVKPSRAEQMARDAYAQLWDQINGTGSWDANPMVWAIEFKRI